MQFYLFINDLYHINGTGVKRLNRISCYTWQVLEWAWQYRNKFGTARKLQAYYQMF